MSAHGKTADLPTAGAPPRASRWWQAAESLLEAAGERLNPILIKEAHQALKSRQFMITFGLLLLCGWVWTILGLAMIGPQVSFGFHGSTMFLGYHVVLSFALLVVVPFGAFRSLAVEQEERTYELLSITALGPRQIVSGKLGSAAVQMVIYLSAISPCLAFTYLLRGIDFPTILFVLFYLVLASLGLSVIALLLGTLTEQKAFQVILSVLTIVGLLAAFGIAWALVANFLEYSRPVFSEVWFWATNAAILTFYGTCLALVFLAAVARITFASDNRSTALRIVIVLQHVAMVGWLVVPAMAEAIRDPEFLIFALCLFAVHWSVLGGLMTGESPELSLRVRRRLPQSFLGRVLLTWFNPGPGTGYLFALGGMLGAAAMAGLALGLWEMTGVARSRRFGPNWPDAVLVFGGLCVCYMAIYLGVGLLVIRLLRRYTRFDVLFAVLVYGLMVLAGCGLPPLVQELSAQWRREGYTLWQITNFVWTLEYVTESRAWSSQTLNLVLVLLPVAAVGVLALNLPAIVREVQYVRVPKPARVSEEDAALAPPPPPPPNASPWDV